MARHIIFIHGRGSKPWSTDSNQDFENPNQIRASRDCLHRLWLRAFMTGLERHASKATFDYWQSHPADIHMAYYGDLLNILNREGSDGTCRELHPTLDDLLRRSLNGSFRSVRGFLRDRGIELTGFISQGLGFKDNLLLNKFRDLRAYVNTHTTGSAIRGRLHRILDPLLDGRHRVALIGHSLGSLVAYDALWKISHRSEFAGLHDRKVDLFATLGSPMGNEAFLNKFRVDAEYERESQFPRNIVQWHNFTARGDFVAHDAKIRNDLRRRKFLRYMERMEDHTRLFNPYINRKGKWNPHKSFAYLLQKELAVVVQDFTQLSPRQ